MLYNQTLEQLTELRLKGMAKAYREADANGNWIDLSFDERLAILVNEEYERRQNNGVKRRIKEAKFKQTAHLSDIIYGHDRNLNKDLITRLSGHQWIKKHENIVITGATGTGKSFLAQALGDDACRHGYRVRYYRLGELLSDLKFGKDADLYKSIRAKLQRHDILILDDWGLAELNIPSGYEISEIIEDRIHARSTIVVSQFPLETWDRIFEDKTTADAVMDRLISVAYTINLKGPSLRSEAASPELREYRESMIE